MVVSRSIFFWICISINTQDDDVDSGRCFFFVFFLREESFIFLVGTEKKHHWKERDLERETRRDCLKSYDVIVFFSFWITPSLSSPPL